LWLRLYAHALLLESRIFPHVKLYDEPLGYMPTGLTDIWKGNRRGEPVCIKAIRTEYLTCLKEIESVRNLFKYYQKCTQLTLYQTFRRETNGRRAVSHPNLLPVIEISGASFPFCIMSPWMPGRNITQYIQMNPDADRLMLVLGCGLLRLIISH
jgi:hypothetical protein